MMSKQQCNKGFSLLEVMIALAIVAIALVSLLGLSNRSILVQDKIQRLTQATMLAQQLMSQVTWRLGTARGLISRAFCRFSLANQLSGYFD